jgi:hypothetical protein
MRAGLISNRWAAANLRGFSVPRLVVDSDFFRRNDDRFPIASDGNRLTEQLVPLHTIPQATIHLVQERLAFRVEVGRCVGMIRVMLDRPPIS